MLFAILQKYDFSSKSQQSLFWCEPTFCCLRYCKSTIFQANHNVPSLFVVLFLVVCDTAKVRFFKQITTVDYNGTELSELFAILQKYDFSSKSQHVTYVCFYLICCLRYCKSTIFQANHNYLLSLPKTWEVVCDTAKVRFFKQITTREMWQKQVAQLFAILQKYDFSSKSQLEVVQFFNLDRLFAILQKYDFSSKSQLGTCPPVSIQCCLRYCKSTIFQANHN